MVGVRDIVVGYNDIETENEYLFLVDEEVTTVGDLKEHISYLLLPVNANEAVEDTHWIPVDEQLIQHDNALLLDDGLEVNTLRRRSTGELSLLLYEKLPLHLTTVTITLPEGLYYDQIMQVQIYNDQSIENLKMRIDDVVGLSPHRQMLRAYGNEMLDGEAIRDYVISLSPLFHLRELPRVPSEMIAVKVKVDDGPFPNVIHTVYLEGSDTINNLCGVARRTGIVTGTRKYYCFTPEGNEVPRNSTLTHAQVGDGSTLHLMELGEDSD